MYSAQSTRGIYAVNLALASRFRFYAEAALASYASILFSDRKYIGCVAMAATFFNIRAGILGLFALTYANTIARAIGVHEDKIRKGLIGFNAILLGLSFSYYYALVSQTLLLLFAAVTLLVFVNVALDHIFGYFFNIPALSIPFVIVSCICYLAFYNYDAASLGKSAPFLFDADFPAVPLYALYYLKALGAIFFQTSPWAGLTILIALICSSRVGFLLSISGFAVGLFFHEALKGDLNDMTGGLVAFNYILTAIALGGIFLIPSPAVFLLALAATFATALVASFVKIFFVSFNMPVLTLPFVLTTQLFLYCVKLLYNRRLRAVDFLPGSPEYNLDFYESRQARFGELGFDIRLPFSGSWLVTQGYNGKWTHQAEWFASLDFMASGSDSLLRRNQSAGVEDFFTFGLPVLAVAAGTVRRVVSHIDDNVLGEINLSENWGNLVLVQHSAVLFSLVCHLKKNSVVVKEGDYVVAGTKLAEAGNSGRSDAPHLHLHFQATSEIGGATVPVSFAQFVRHGGVDKIEFNAVPHEGDMVANLVADFNTKTFFALVPGQTLHVRLDRGAAKEEFEVWRIKIDFLGVRFIENEHGDRLLYAASNDWFAAFDYRGRRRSALFILFATYYRVPFSRTPFAFEDRISYKYFVSWPMRFARDLVLPFTRRVSLTWAANPAADGAALCSAISVGKRAVFVSSADCSGAFPGTITALVDGADCKLLAA